MSRTCQVTGARPGFGNNVSHSHRRTKRRWGVNVQSKRYWVGSLGRRVTLTLSPRGIRTGQVPWSGVAGVPSFRR